MPLFLIANSGDYGFYPSVSETHAGVYLEGHLASATVLRTDNFTTLDGLYALYYPYFSRLSPSGGTIESNVSLARYVGSSPPAIIAYSLHNSYMIEALGGTSSWYLRQWQTVSRYQAVDVVYDNVLMSVMFIT